MAICSLVDCRAGSVTACTVANHRFSSISYASFSGSTQVYFPF